MIHTLTITATGGPLVGVLVTAASTPMQWIEIFNPSTNSGNIAINERQGTLIANRPITPGNGLLLPPVAAGGYNGNQICVSMAINDSAIITYQDFQ